MSFASVHAAHPWDDVLAAIGYGRSSVQQVLSKVAPNAVLDTEKPRPAATRPKAEQGVRIRGVDDLLGEIRVRAEKNERVLVTTLTKKNDVVTCEQRIFKLWHHRVFVTKHAFKQWQTCGNALDCIASQFFFDRK